MQPLMTLELVGCTKSGEFAYVATRGESLVTSSRYRHDIYAVIIPGIFKNLNKLLS